MSQQSGTRLLVELLSNHKLMTPPILTDHQPSILEAPRSQATAEAFALGADLTPEVIAFYGPETVDLARRRYARNLRRVTEIKRDSPNPDERIAAEEIINIFRTCIWDTPIKGFGSRRMTLLTLQVLIGMWKSEVCIHGVIRLTCDFSDDEGTAWADNDVMDAAALVLCKASRNRETPATIKHVIVVPVAALYYYLHESGTRLKPKEEQILIMQ